MDDVAKQPDIVRGTTPPSALIKQAMHDLALSALVYNKNPLAKPRVRHDLLHLPAAVRIAEVLRYSIMCFEYRLGPDGWVRGWLFFISRILIILLGLSGTACMVIWSLVPIFGGVDSLAHHVASIAEHLFWATLFSCLGCCSCWALFALIGRGGKRERVKYVASRQR